MFLQFRNSIPPTTTVENLKVKASTAKEEIFIDVAFWGGIIPGNEVYYFKQIVFNFKLFKIVSMLRILIILFILE